MAGHLQVSPDLHRRLVVAAQGFRKEPTTSERILWQALRGGRLGVKFRRQHPIGPFIVDFLCVPWALVVEVDGLIHDGQVEHDHERQELLEACGYRVMRITSHDVEHNLDAVINRIRNALVSCENRGASLQQWP